MRGLYIHIPFCRKKCIYCHFVSGIPYTEETVRWYINLLLTEAKIYQKIYGSLTFDTLYLGGGTPSLLSFSLLAHLIEEISKIFVLKTKERTIEVNPEDVNKTNIAFWKEIGFNRISLGFQAIQPEILSFLSRPIFDPDRVYEIAANTFSRINVDFITGIKEINIDKLFRWIEKYLPPHLSLYLLSSEQGSTLAGLEKRGCFHFPEPEFQAEQHLFIATHLSPPYQWYEISNFSLGKKNQALHNTLYWTYHPYIGLGIGASGFIIEKKLRYTNVSHFSSYEKNIRNHQFPYQYTEILDENTQKMEKIMLSLRTSEGIALSTLKKWMPSKGIPILLQTLERFSPYCQQKKNRIVLTAKGRMVANTIITEIWHTIEPLLKNKKGCHRQPRSHRAGLNR